jgi:hypothetical protein
MSGGMRPYLYDEEYSAILLGVPGLRSPGVVKLSGPDRNKNWDIQKAKGQSGASTKLNGDDIGQFEAEFFLAADEVDEDGRDDFDRWEDFQRLVESTTSGPSPVALPIYHPDLARNHFTAVTNGGIGGMVHDGQGGARIKVKFLEYKPPKPKPAAKAKPKAAGAAAPGSTGPAGNVKPDPNAAAKAELAALLAEAKKP